MTGLAARPKAAPPWVRWLLFLSGAVLMGVCIQFPALGVLQWVALLPSAPIILMLATDPQVRLRRMYGYGFCFFGCFYLTNFHWFLYMYPLSFAGLSNAASAVVIAAAWLGLSALQTLAAAATFPLFALAVRGRFLSDRPILHPILFAVLWTVREWIQANMGWAGVPWARLPLGQVGLRLTVQSAAYLGSYFITFLLVAVSMLLGFLLLYPDRARLCGILAASLVCGDLALGGIRLLTLPQDGETLSAAAAQGNLSSLEKWSPGSGETALERYESLTREAAAEGATLIVWPETALTITIDQSPGTRARISQLAVETGATLLVGAFTSGEDARDQYNSVLAFLPNGEVSDTVYNKQKPVPFGEFVPFRELVMLLIPPLAEVGMLDRDLLVGEESVVFDLPTGRIGALICFDSIYESTALDSVRGGAQLLTVSTNDSWFQDSRGVWMHNAQSSLRAIETGRYVVRTGNTGVSSIIDPTGKVKKKLDPLLTGQLTGEVALRDETTLYVRTGNLFAWVCAAFAAATVLSALYTEGVLRRSARRNVHISDDSVKNSENTP